MGGSVSIAKSEQKAKVNLAQQFAGTCDVSCQNVMDDINVTVIDSDVTGGIDITQTCATNASCLIGSNMDAIADVSFKATNSTNAKDSWSIWSGDPFNFDKSISESRQNIKEQITQVSNETCDISSYNQMNDISIFAANSTIGGGISISQNASTQGQCQLNNTMSAAAYASGQTSNVAKSGKDKKGQKFGGKLSGFEKILVYIAIAIAVIVVVFIIAKIISKVRQRKKLSLKK